MIRILRLMEYTYDTPERAQEDMDKWQVPANGSYKVGGRAGNLVIRSAVITDLNFKDEANA